MLVIDFWYHSKSFPSLLCPPLFWHPDTPFTSNDQGSITRTIRKCGSDRIESPEINVCQFSGATVERRTRIAVSPLFADNLEGGAIIGSAREISRLAWEILRLRAAAEAVLADRHFNGEQK